MKILILGDSHITSAHSALKSNESIELGDVSPHLVGMPNQRFFDSKYVDGKIIVAAKNTKFVHTYRVEVTNGELDLDSYDLIVFWGFLRLHEFLGNTAKFLSEQRSFYSKDFLISGALSWLKESDFFKFIQPILSDHARKIIVVPQPIPAEGTDRLRKGWQKGYDFNQWKWSKIELETRKYLLDIVSCAFGKLGLDVVIQPGCTFNDSGYTNREFCSGSISLFHDKEHKETDLAHMNGLFGKIMLEEIVSHISKGKV